VLCIIFVFIGLYHLLIYAFRKTDYYNILFAAFTAIAAAYYFAQTQIVYSLISNTEYGQRLDYALMYILIFTGVAFFETINTGKISKVTVAYGIFGTVLAVAQWFFPIWFAYGLVSVWRYTTILYMAYAFVFNLLWQIYKGAVKLNQDADSRPGLWRGIYRYLFQSELGIIDIMLITVGATAIMDIINIAVFNVNFPLKNYSLLGFAMSMAYILTRKYSTRYEVDIRESVAIQEQSLANAGLTQEEINVAMLMIEGATQREISRKFHINAAEVRQRENAVRQKLGLISELDIVIAAVVEEYGLTKREKEMLRYLHESVPTEQIAVDLFISEGTVRSHVSSLLSKLGIEKRQDVAKWLESRGEKTE
jgi:DNA-binding CsgD family transcriptional regulator